MRVLNTYPQVNDVLKIKNIIEENIDKTNPWGYFDGSAAGDPHLCGVGGILYIKDDHYITFKAGLGTGTNNFAQICALKLLLSLALGKQISKIMIFGDSLLVINWVTCKIRIHNLELSQIVLEVIRISNLFEYADFKHIYS